MSLKLRGELCVMTMKNEAKFEIELANFNQSTQSSQNRDFHLILLYKVENVRA